MNPHNLITAPLAQFSSQPPPRSGRLKFTPERIQQIKNLVERGKSREEIAELIAVPVGSLQVTCSRLGISLRRLRLDNGIRSLPRGRPARSNKMTMLDSSRDSSAPAQPTEEQSQPNSQPGPLLEQTQRPTPRQERPKANEADLPNFFLRMHYKGKERTTGLALTQDAISQLALEAWLRDMRIGELIGDLITAMTRKTLFQRVLDVS
jgi:hypothetical protein